MKRRIGLWLDGIRQDEHQLALVLSLVIGALVGLVIVAFILLTGRLAARMYPAGVAAWRRLLVPTVGSLVAGYLLYRYFPLARGSGIPQTKFALFVVDGLITMRTVVGKFVCCAVTLASGIALGREGPSVHIGAGIASVIGRGVGLSAERVKALIPVGGSAALAAAFNTPIAGVLFSLEEIMGDLHAPILGAVVLSSATAWMVLHLFLGDAPLFHVSGYQLVHPVEFAIYAVLGVIGGLASVCFVKLLLGLRRRFLGFGESWVWLHPAVGGLTVGLLGFFVPEVLGVGYDYVERVLNGDVVLQALVLLAVLKIVATAVSYGSGNAGGIFGPSLFIGAMVGGAVGSAAHTMFPLQTAEPGAYALVGMGTAFAGIVRTPLTSVIMIFELTRDYTIIVPLMISNLIAFYVSYRLQRVPVYEAIALQDGVHLPTGESRGYAGGRVAQAMRPTPHGVSPGTLTGDAAARLQETALEAWPVIDHEGLVGMAEARDLQAAVDNGMQAVPLLELHRAISPGGRRSSFSHLHPDHSLALALERMGTSGHRVLPVVSRADVRRLIGIVTLGDVLAAFGVAGKEREVEPARESPAPASRSAFLTTVGAIVAAIAVLVVVDTWLARKEAAETRDDAVRLFQEGTALQSRGLHDQAIERFQGALSLVRGERDYQIGLARAELAAGRTAAARKVLDDVLRRNANDGEANLLMGRVLAKLGRPGDAGSYYHRAIYGQWRQDAGQRRTQARLELVELLAREGSSEEVLAELLPLQEKTGDPAIEHRIARLYLAAGAPDRAIAVWRRLQESQPDDPDVLAGIGDAELARKNYRTAQATFERALRLRPEDEKVRERLALSTDVLALDPTRRGLRSTERYARSVQLVELVRASLEGCPESAGLHPDVKAATPPPRGGAVARDEATEANLALAEQLWQTRVQRCKAPLSAPEERLALVLTRTAQ